jgi:hypothetical protein
VTREHSGSSTASTLRESLSRSAFATVEPGNTPKASDIWAALGGPRGLVESLLPGLSFLVVYSFTQSVGWSVAAPMTVAVGFIVARLIQRSPLQPAVIGFVGIAASAAVAVLSGRPENNFLLGLWVNAITLVILLASMALGRPLIGVVAGLLTADPQWRDDRAKTVMAMVATAIWSAMFGLRLTVQVPLYLAGESGVQALAMAKLVMGVPLYGATLWLTWLLLRSVYRGSSAPAS